jgi:phosphate-selective porin
MKTIKTLRIVLFASAIAVSGSLIATGSYAQGVDSAIRKVGQTGKKVGQKTASVAVKGASKVADKTYKGKEGPNGETVYIDKRDRKYIVDGKGKKIYLDESDIRDKKEH